MHNYEIYCCIHVYLALSLYFNSQHIIRHHWVNVHYISHGPQYIWSVLCAYAHNCLVDQIGGMAVHNGVVWFRITFSYRILRYHG